jgi:hypothetical protein
MWEARYAQRPAQHKVAGPQSASHIKKNNPNLFSEEKQDAGSPGIADDPGLPASNPDEDRPH